MSYYFDVGTKNEAFYLDIPEIDPTNLSMSCWFNADDADTFYVPMAVNDKDADNDHHRLSLRGPAGGDPIDILSWDGGATRASSTNSFSAGTWHHAFGDVSGTQPRRIWLDAAGLATDTTAKTIDNLDRISIGSIEDLTPSAYMQGYIAEVAVWLDVATLFTVGEVEALAAGWSPAFFKPRNLIFYAKLIRETVDEISGTALTAVGDPNVSSLHPRMIYPSKIWVPHKAVAAGVVNAAGQADIVISSLAGFRRLNRPGAGAAAIVTSSLAGMRRLNRPGAAQAAINIQTFAGATGGAAAITLEEIFRYRRFRDAGVFRRRNLKGVY